LALAAATGSAFLFRALHHPLACILGALNGAAVVANLTEPKKGPPDVTGQLFAGASVGASSILTYSKLCSVLFPAE
jgi:uncharacterized membrane protein AbrB (regulator of aidB expression)